MENAKRVLVYDRIDANRRRTWLLLVVSGVIVLPTLVLFALPFSGFAMIVILMILGWPELTNSWYLVMWLVTLGGLALLTFLIALHITDWAILRLARARLLAPDEEQDYQRIVENICIGSGLPLPRLYVIEYSPPNAFSVGRDPDDSAIAVSRSLLALLNRNELEGVLAHELSHIGNQDTSLSTLTAAMTLCAQAAFRNLAGVVHIVRSLGWRCVPLFPPMLVFAFTFGAYLVMSAALTAPSALIGPFLRASISRGREYLADADAVLLTRYPKGLARALAKIEASTASSAKVDGVIAHLFIVNPLREDASWWDTIFSTHPPVKERIAALAGMGGGISPSVLREAAEAGAKFTPAATVVATSLWEERALADEATQSAEAAPPAERGRAPGRFRLKGAGTTLYERPDTASAALSQLPGGALITVIERQGDFLRVITAGDRYGYILRGRILTRLSYKQAGGPWDTTNKWRQ